MRSVSTGRLAVLWIMGTSVLPGVRAQLPTARLDGLSPRGVQAGGACEVTLQGSDLDGVHALLFSHPGLTARSIEGGRFQVMAAEDVPPGVHEVRAAGRHGVSTGTVFVVGSGPECPEPPDNHDLRTAPSVPLGVTINATAEAEASDFYRIAVQNGQAVTIDCAAQRIDSPMDAVLTVHDPSGREMIRVARGYDRDPSVRFVATMDGEHTIEVHDVTWRGGPSFAYRLTLSPDPPPVLLPTPAPLAGSFLPPPSPSPITEVEPNDTAEAAQPLTTDVELTGRLDRDWFTLRSETARPLIIEVASHRLGLPSDPVVVIYKTGADPSGGETSETVAQFDDIPSPPGCERFRLGSRDPAGRLMVEAGVTYRLLLTDRFQTGAPYRLLIREPKPDFRVLVMPESPATEGKSVMRWTPVLRRQGTTLLAAAVVRLDGFEETVTLDADTLPAGVTMAACPVPAGRSAGLLILRASADAPAWTGPLLVTGHAAGRSSRAQEATPRWNVGDTGVERLDLRLSPQGPMLTVTGEGEVPLQVEAAAAGMIETSLGATLQIPVKFLRAAGHRGFKGEWEAALIGLPGQRAWQPSKPAADAADAALSLSLTQRDGNRFVAGTWNIYAATRGTVQWQPDEKIPVREVRDTAYSAPVQVRVDSSPVAISAAESLALSRGASTTLPVKLDRRYGFGGEVEVLLRLPGGLKGVKTPVVVVAKETAEAALPVEIAADALSGRHNLIIEAKCQWNGEELVARRDLILEIAP